MKTSDFRDFVITLIQTKRSRSMCTSQQFPCDGGHVYNFQEVNQSGEADWSDI